MSNAIIRAMRVHAAADPARLALRGDRRDLDYATLLQEVDAVAAWLVAHGVRRAALCGGNSPEWLVADLAAWHAGAVLIPMPAFFSAAQREHVLSEAGIEHLLLCGESADGTAAEAGLESPVPGIRLARVVGVPSAVDVPFGTCKITFTSGTTGRPKGVCLDPRMLESVAAALAARIHGAPGLQETRHAHFTLLPLATLLENVAGAYVPWLLGEHVVVRSEAQTGLLGSSQLDVGRLLRALHRDQPQSLIVLPQILRGLVLAAEQGAAPPASLRFVAVGGATTPAALIARARQAGLPVFEGYGLSECGSVVALNAPGADRPGSVGRVLPHVRVRIEAGSIQVAGNACAGYLGQPAPDGGGWLDTGDLGHLDEDGFLYVTGRRKHVLITGYGRNVSPEWVESELSLAPGVAQVMVVGEARAYLGAIVVPSGDVEPAALIHAISRINARLPDYARIRRFLIAAEPFTVANGLLTDNGRLRRDGVAARFADGIEALFSSTTSAMEPAHEVL